MPGRAKDRRNILEEEIENRNIRKRWTRTLSFLLVLLFCLEKIIFCWKTYLEKLSSYFYICISFFARQVIRNVVITHHHLHRYIHWSCRQCTSSQNTWQQTRYFNVDFVINGWYIFSIFQSSTFNLEKSKSIC